MVLIVVLLAINLGFVWIYESFFFVLGSMGIGLLSLTKVWFLLFGSL